MDRLDGHYDWIFMVGLDARIVIVGLPQVAVQLKADAEQAIWITQSYLLATTAMLLLIGRLADIFGRVKIYSYGFAVFTVGSALTSLGTDANQVIIFRAVQGLGAALIFANSIAIVTDSTPRRQLGLFVGFNQIAYRAGALFGLTISGLILSFLDWRALFYVNIPVGIFGIVWARVRLKETGHLDSNRKIDWAGFASFTVFLLGLMLGLTFVAYGLTDSTVVYALLAVSVVSLAVFGVRERKIDYPLVDFHMLRIRQVTGGIFAVLLNVIAWGAVLLLLSLQFQLVLDESPLQAGISILPFEIAFLAVGPVSGRLSDKFGHVRFVLAGLVFSSVAMFLLSTIRQTTPYAILSLYMALLGVGTGLFLAPNLRGVMGSLPEYRRGIGSAMVSLFLNLGLAISLNFAVAIMSLTAPYGLITRIISAVNPMSISSSDKTIFFDSITNTYGVVAIINALAIVPALLQVERKHGSTEKESSLPSIPVE